MIVITIENTEGSQRAITVTGASGDEMVHQDLRPGETARIAVSRATLLSLSEADERIDAKGHAL